MIYPYKCEACRKRSDVEFPMGKNPRELECYHCGQRARRVYEGMSIALKIGSSFSKTSFGEQMKSKNLEAGKRMKARKPPVRVIAHDYGNGDIREAVTEKAGV